MFKNHQDELIYHRKWYSENRRKCIDKQILRNNTIYKYDNKYNERRIIALQIYSNGMMKCKKCGYDKIDCLDIDHIKGNKKIKSPGYGDKLYKWLEKNRYPIGFQILCRNCNWEKWVNDQKI